MRDRERRKYGIIHGKRQVVLTDYQSVLKDIDDEIEIVSKTFKIIFPSFESEYADYVNSPTLTIPDLSALGKRPHTASSKLSTCVNTSSASSSSTISRTIEESEQHRSSSSILDENDVEWEDGFIEGSHGCERSSIFDILDIAALGTVNYQIVSHSLACFSTISST
jgi:hypothetical protein